MKSRPKDYWRYKIGPKEYGWTSQPGYGERFVHISVLDEANRVKHFWEGKYNKAEWKVCDIKRQQYQLEAANEKLRGHGQRLVLAVVILSIAVIVLACALVVA